MIYFLPTLIEKNVSDYIEENYSGSYNVAKAFETEEYIAPLVIIRAGDCVEVERGINVYRASCSIMVVTQVDETSLPITTHDNTCNDIFSLFNNPDAVADNFNARDNGHAWGFFIDSFSMDRDGRTLISTLTFTLDVQNLAI